MTVAVPPGREFLSLESMLAHAETVPLEADSPRSVAGLFAESEAEQIALGAALDTPQGRLGLEALIDNTLRKRMHAFGSPAEWPAYREGQNDVAWFLLQCVVKARKAAPLPDRV